MRRVLVDMKTLKVLRVCDSQGQSLSASFNLKSQAERKRKQISISCFELLTSRKIGETITSSDLGTHHFGEKWVKV